MRPVQRLAQETAGKNARERLYRTLLADLPWPYGGNGNTVILDFDLSTQLRSFLIADWKRLFNIIYLLIAYLAAGHAS